MIARVQSYARRNDYHDVRIRYTEAGTKKSKQAVVEAGEEPSEQSDAARAVEKLVSRTCKIDLQEPMHYDHTEVVDSFATLAIDKLIAEKSG